jgi:hypothetical protein
LADPELVAITKRATIDLVTARGRPSQELFDRLYLIGYINKAEADAVEEALAGDGKAKGGRRGKGLGRGLADADAPRDAKDQPELAERDR